MNSEKIIKATADWVKEKLIGENSGHDWNHAEAVWKNAKEIVSTETGVNNLVVELAALLHDINDWKLSALDDEKSAQIAENWLREIVVDENTISHVLEIIKKVSFFGPNFVEEEMTPEGQIVRDADRLEAMGPIAWERTRQFGKAKGIPVINEYLPNLNLTDEEYKNYMRKENSCINHVFEKLLLLKKRLVTKRGKEIGLVRHEELKTVVRNYLESIEDVEIVQKERVGKYIQMLEEPRFN